MRKITILATLLALMVTSPAQAATAYQLKVYYAGPQGGVRQALQISEVIQLVDDPNQARVLVLNGLIPDPEQFRKLLQSGTGLVLIFGPQVKSQEVQTLLGLSLQLRLTNTDLSLLENKGVQDSLLRQIAWNSSPQVRQRTVIPNSIPDLTPLVLGYEDQELVLGRMQAGAGTAYIFTPYLNSANSQLQEWAYFNYLIYSLSLRAAGVQPQSFSDYPQSPVPHATERAALILLLSGLLILALAAFWLVRRYSRSHPELLEDLVVDRQEFETRQAHTEWDEVGFHRPLGGFMLAFMLGLVLFIPLIIYQNLILPVYILPSAQALGIWGRVVQLFNFLWLLFDMGTSAAFIKFFAEYRVLHPRQAIQYGQVFVWWQALSGAAQVALITALAGTLLPRSVYALYTWSIIVHTFIQIPGFYQVMRHALMAWQRFDYAQILEVGLYAVFPIITQPVLVTLMVAWGKRHPAFGGAMGGLLGLGLAAYLAEAMTFVIGIWLYRRLGYNARLLFLAHFDWQTIKRSFRFGVFEMIGSVAWAIGQAMEVVITQNRLINYTEIWGNWGLAQNFVFAFNILQSLYNNLMPSISESISHARKALSQYYAALAYKWGGAISAFVASVLLAVADRFILGATGPEFRRAAAYTIPLVIWGAVQYPSWVGDTVQLGANRPYLKTAMIAGEQFVRILLAFALLERFQINALIIAYFVGLLAKDILVYFINDRLCYPQRFYFWQSLGAPALAGAAHFFVLRYATGLVWRGDQVSSVLIFLIGILLSYPLYAFFYGLFGGWDDDTLQELHNSVRLSSFMRLLALIFYEATAAGARLSPLHGRFPIDIRAAALSEADSLTIERVKL